MKKYLPILLLCLYTGSYAQHNFDSVTIESIAINDHLYMLKGEGGNIGVLTGTDGVLMVDDQYAPLSDKIKAAISALDKRPIRFIINTHVHGDHSGGNEKFATTGTTIVAHENVRVRMMNPHGTDTNIQPPRDKEAWPVITFAEEMRLHLNGEDIEVFHSGNAHTDGDIIVHFKQSNVIHAGDVFVRYGYPYIDVSRGGGIEGFILFVEKLLHRMDDQTVVIPGHGELATKADVQLFYNRLTDLRDHVVKALKQGVAVEEVTSLPFVSKYDGEWGRGFTKGKDFVLMIAEYYSKHTK